MHFLKGEGCRQRFGRTPPPWKRSLGGNWIFEKKKSIYFVFFIPYFMDIYAYIYSINYQIINNIHSCILKKKWKYLDLHFSKGEGCRQRFGRTPPPWKRSLGGELDFWKKKVNILRFFYTIFYEYICIYMLYKLSNNKYNLFMHIKKKVKILGLALFKRWRLQTTIWAGTPALTKKFGGKLNFWRKKVNILRFFHSIFHGYICIYMLYKLSNNN